MKKVYIYILGLLFITGIYSCQDVNDKFDDLDAISAPPNDEKEAYTLTSDDYSSIAKFALQNDPNDTLNADTIADYEFFTNTVSASKYIPALLADMYPAFGFGSSAMVTYNFNPENSYPLYQERFNNADLYKVDSADYAFVSTECDEYQAFTPNYPPDDHLPIILARAFAGNADIDYVYTRYDYTAADQTYYYEDDFPTNISNYTVIDNLGTQSWYHSSYGSDTYAKISGYDGANDNANEDWLITQGIDLTDANATTKLVFNHAINFLDAGNTVNAVANVYISTDFNGTDEASANWVKISDLINWPDGGSYNWFNSGEVSLSSYIGQTIYIAFVYTTTDADSPTWQINDISVFSGSAPYEKGDYYENNNGIFSKVNNVYVLNDLDYIALGAPGKYQNFSDDEPADAYLPGFLTDLFTIPYVGQVEKIAYKTYSGGTNYMMEEYIYTGAAIWEKYSPVIENTDQFLVDNTGKWVFDPTITNIMSKEDFQMIVDFVKANYGESYINSYGTGEIYHGADAYYGNFDIRDGKYDKSVFETWEDAVISALSVAFLPTKYPDAQLQVDGIDQLFIIGFNTYSGEGGNHKWVFQVTKAGPNPEFTFVEELE